MSRFSYIQGELGTLAWHLTVVTYEGKEIWRQDKYEKSPGEPNDAIKKLIKAGDIIEYPSGRIVTCIKDGRIPTK